MKKVLVLTSTFPRWVGDTNPPFVFELSRRLTKKFEVTILAPHYPKSKDFEIMDKLKIHRFRYFIEKFEKLAGNGGILPTIKSNILYLFVVPFFILFEVVETLKLVKKIKPNIVHAHWIVPQGIAAYVNFLINKTPYVITSHGSDLHTLGFRFVKKIILHNAKKITVVSNYLKEEIFSLDPKLLKKTVVIPMGVDTKQFNPDKYDESIKKKYNIVGKFLLFVGRLSPEKGIDLLIDAMPAVIRKYPKTKLLIIGGGVLGEQLKDKVNKLKIYNNVIFLGAIKHDCLPAYFATADIFVSPSLREGSPVTYIEAISSGTQVVVGDIPISREIVTPEYGEYVSQNVGLIAKCLINKISTKTKGVNKGSDYSAFDWNYSLPAYFKML